MWWIWWVQMNWNEQWNPNFKIVLEIGSLKNCRWQWSMLNNLNVTFCFISTIFWTDFCANTFSNTLFITDWDLYFSKQGITLRCHGKFISEQNHACTKSIPMRRAFSMSGSKKHGWSKGWSSSIFPLPLQFFLWPEFRQSSSYWSACCAAYLGQNTVVSQLPFLSHKHKWVLMN